MRRYSWVSLQIKRTAPLRDYVRLANNLLRMTLDELRHDLHQTEDLGEKAMLTSTIQAYEQALKYGEKLLKATGR